MSTTTIRYINFFNQKRDQAKTITHEELDNQDSEFFKQGFNELLPENGLRRLYFDVELDKTDDYSEGYLNEVINWFDTIAKDLKTYYAACGYTTNESIFKEYKDDKKMLTKLMLAFKTDESIKHMLSFHVIFNKVFDAKDIYEVFKDPKCVLVKPCVDLSVYKGDNKQQTFRHAFSTKRKSYNESTPTEIDVVANVFDASNLCVTPDGSEAVGDIDELKKAFHYRSDEDVKARQAKIQEALLKRLENEQKINVDDSDEDGCDATVKCCEILLRAVCGKEFKREQTMHDVVAFLPRSKDKDINGGFVNAYNKLYNEVPHNTPENIEELHMKLKHCNGFCTCMSNIKNKYFEKHGYEHIMELNNRKAAKLKLTEEEQAELDDYELFIVNHRTIVNFYFRFYDYIHTTANEKKFLQRCLSSNKCHTKFYAQCYVRKMLYIANEKYLYRKTLYDTQTKSLDSSSFKIYLKRVFKGIGDIGEKFNRKLKVFHSEDLLESRDGLVYPRYRDLDYNMTLTNDEFNTFITAYKATFKDQCCADFAVKILIQDIASGFHDNSSIIKFYYGTGGNNKDCETCIYENIIAGDLVFKTSNFEVLADEKNIKVVSSLYVQFNEMPANNKDKFNVFINALKNYNEQGKQTTRGLFENFTTINTNIRFQCNTNNPALRDWLLDNANDAIKRRFFVAERVHSDQWSDWLYDFTHNENKCKALKMYIKDHSDELYTEKLNSMTMLQFYKDHEDIYTKYIEAKADDEFEELKEALCCSGCVKGKRSEESVNEEFTVKIRDWHHQYVGENKKKCSESMFRSKVNQYIAYVKNAYVKGKRTGSAYFITDKELIQALNNYTNAHTSIDTSAVNES